MPLFKSPTPGVVIYGTSILSMVDGMGAFRSNALKILEENGIKDIKPNNLYSQQKFLNSLKIIYERLGDVTIKVIGMKIPDKVQLPSNIESIDQILHSIDRIYNMNHQGGDCGHYKFEKTGKSEGIIVVDTPYPCSFDIGLIEAFMNKFREDGSIPSLKHHSEECRMKGAPACEYRVKW
jgi:hypothetical protein